MFFKNIVLQLGSIRDVEDLVSKFDAIAELARDDVRRICEVKGWFFWDFDCAYTAAIGMTAKTLCKRNLKSIKRFYQAEDIGQAANWLLVRLVSNVRNVAFDNRYRGYCGNIKSTLNANGGVL